MRPSRIFWIDIDWWLCMIQYKNNKISYFLSQLHQTGRVRGWRAWEEEFVLHRAWRWCWKWDRVSNTHTHKHKLLGAYRQTKPEGWSPETVTDAGFAETYSVKRFSQWHTWPHSWPIAVVYTQTLSGPC